MEDKKAYRLVDILTGVVCIGWTVSVLWVVQLNGRKGKDMYEESLN